MSAYTYIKAIATALKNDAAILSHCTTAFSRGCLVRIDDFPAYPLTSADCPFLCVTKVPTQELGQVADMDEWKIAVIAGVAMGDDSEVPAETATRSTSANGLQQIGDAEAAETLLGLALVVIRALALGNGAMVYSIAEDSDGWATLPLQTATAEITIRRQRTMQEW